MEWSGAPYGIRVGQVTDDSRELHEELQRAVFPRYQVGEEIGRGGMSIVYRAWDTVELRPVAIKVLKHQYSTVLGSHAVPSRDPAADTVAAPRHPSAPRLRPERQPSSTSPCPWSKGRRSRPAWSASRSFRSTGPADPFPGGCGARLRARHGSPPPRHQAQQSLRHAAIGRCWPTSASRRTSRRRSRRAPPAPAWSWGRRCT